MLQQARRVLGEEFPAQRVALLRASIEQLPFASDCFDLVASAGVLEYLDADAPAIAELARVLKPGGHLLLPITNAWSPAGWLDPPIEWLKRRASFLAAVNALRRGVGAAELRARHFRVRKQTRAALHAELQKAGMSIQAECYFHFLPWPRPLDKLLPGLSTAIGSRMEPLGETWLGPLGEGHLSLARKEPGR
jgi:ubiquinone/menaquinone biosynthesis C-methylase UbiE